MRPARIEDPRDLPERRIEVVDLLDDVAAPDEVEMTVRERELLHDTHEDLGAICDAGVLDGRSRARDVHLDGVDADAVTP